MMRKKITNPQKKHNQKTKEFQKDPALWEKPGGREG